MSQAKELMGHIEKNVPIPRVHISEWEQLVLKMEIGNSIVCNYHQRTTLMRVARSTKRKFTSRSIKNGTYFRCWRIK